MAVALRLSRGGSKKRPFYRIVAADVRSPRDGRFIERLGTYNPMKNKDDPERLNMNKPRIKYWLSVGAKPTNRVAKFIALEGLGEMPKIFPQTKKDKPRTKTIEKNKAREEKRNKISLDEKETKSETQGSETKPITEETTPPDVKTKDESATDAKNESTAEAKAESNSETKAEPALDAKSESSAEANAEPASKAKVEPVSDKSLPTMSETENKTDVEETSPSAVDDSSKKESWINQQLMRINIHNSIKGFYWLK